MTPNTSIMLLSKGKGVGPPVKSNMTFKYQYPKDTNHKATQLRRIQKELWTLTCLESCQMKENEEN